MHVAYKHKILYSKNYKRCSDIELFQPLQGYFPESLISWVDNFSRDIKQPQTKDLSTIQILAQTRIILLQYFYLIYGFFLTINPTTSICIVPGWGQIPTDIGFQ